MTAEEITIPVSYIKTLLAQVEEKGYDPQILLDEVGIDRQ